VVKSCIEYGGHRYCASENLPRCVDAAHRRRIVQRCEIVQGLDARERLFIDHRRPGKEITAVDYAMRDGIDPVYAGASRHCQIETLNDFTHPDLMIGRGDFLLQRSELAASLELENGVLAKPVEQTHDQFSILRNSGQISCRFDQLKLDRGAAAVEYQNVHRNEFRRIFFESELT